MYHSQQKKKKVLLHCQEVLEEVPPKMMPTQKTVSRNIFLILHINSKCLSFLHKPLVSLHDPKGHKPPAQHREGFVLKFLLLTWALRRWPGRSWHKFLLMYLSVCHHITKVPPAGPKKGSDFFPTAVLLINSQGLPWDLKCLLDAILL